LHITTTLTYLTINSDKSFVSMMAFGIHELTETLGWLAIPATVMLFLSPVEVIRKIVKEKDVGGFSPVPYLATVLNCSLWLMYGLTKGNLTQLLVVNTFGKSTAAIYLGFFMWYTREKIQLCMQIAGTVGACAALWFISVALRPKIDQVFLLGVFGTVAGALMFSGPLAVASEVIRTKSVKYMPLMPSVFALMATSFWSSFAILKGDTFVLLGNVPGFFLAVLQLALYYKYSTPDADEKTALMA